MHIRVHKIHSPSKINKRLPARLKYILLILIYPDLATPPAPPYHSAVNQIVTHRPQFPLNLALPLKTAPSPTLPASAGAARPHLARHIDRSDLAESAALLQPSLGDLGEARRKQPAAPLKQPGQTGAPRAAPRASPGLPRRLTGRGGPVTR